MPIRLQFALPLIILRVACNTLLSCNKGLKHIWRSTELERVKYQFESFCTALILLPLQLTATESNEPLNPLLSLNPTKVRSPLCALCLCGSIPVYHRVLPHASPAQINSHRVQRAAQSSSLPAPPPRSVVLCALCVSVVLFPYTTVYCLMLPPLRLTATESNEPLNPLFSLNPSKGCRPLCALRLCGWVSA